METQRLDKLLSNMCNIPRSKVKEYIKKGRAVVNGEVCRNPEQKIMETDEVLFDNRPVRKSRFKYYMLNKPAGYLSATKDNHERTVIDIFKQEGIKDLFPVGRLDKDTVGLLLVTNDGELSHYLLSPNREVPKTYFARVNGCLAEEYIDAFAKGFDFKEFTSKPAELVIVENDRTQGVGSALVTVTEGRFHEVKRLFAKVGLEVTYLKRTCFAGLGLDEQLKEGSYRELTEEELKILNAYRA